jgi:hypothetical protein
MTIDVLHGPVERPRDEPLEPFAIGEPDANIFLCPSCARPLAVGVARCGACGTRLVAGVRLVKAAGFVALGLAAGVMLGGGAVGAILVTDRTVAAVPGQVPAPAASVAPGSSAVTGPVDATIPASALSALRQSTLVNQRLIADADRLRQALKARRPSAETIAPILRSLATTAAFGDRIAPTVGGWDEARAVSKGLASLYSSIGRVADDGLSAALTNDGAYGTAGRRMRSVLDRIKDLDAASRGLATVAGVELPPLVPK